MRSHRGKRIFQETSEQPVWYLQLWQSLSVDLSAENGIISRVDKSGFLRTLGTTIMPAIASVLLIAPLVNTWQAIKNYYHSNNKNLDKTLDLLVNILMTVTSVGVMATLLAGVVYISPYILIVAMSAGLSYAVYNVVKHAYAAWCAHQEEDDDRAKQHLWAIPYHLILTVLSGLGLLVQLNYAFNITVINGIFNIVTISDTTYNVAQILLYTFGFMITLGSMPAFARVIMEYNNETLKMLANPLASINELLFGKEGPDGHENGLWDRIQKGFNFCKEQPLKATLLFIPTVIKLSVEAIGYIAVGTMRLIAAALSPLQLVGTGVTKAIGFIKNLISPAPQIANLAEDPISIAEKESTAQTMNMMLVARHTKLRTAIEAEITHLRAQEYTPKIAAKYYYMTVLQDKLGNDVDSYEAISSLDSIRQDALAFSPRLYQSFFRMEGRVEKIDRQFEEFDTGLKEAKTLGFFPAISKVNAEVEKSEVEVTSLGHSRAVA